MSVRHVEAVFASALPAWLKPYASALATYANDETDRRVYPSVRRIARMTGRTERSTQYAIGALRRQGILELVTPATRHRANEYRFVLERLPQLNDEGQMLLFYRPKSAIAHETKQKRLKVS